MFLSPVMLLVCVFVVVCLFIYLFVCLFVFCLLSSHLLCVRVLLPLFPIHMANDSAPRPLDSRAMNYSFDLNTWSLYVLTSNAYIYIVLCNKSPLGFQWHRKSQTHIFTGFMGT